jgi:hypothetical protein
MVIKIIGLLIFVTLTLDLHAKDEKEAIWQAFVKQSEKIRNENNPAEAQLIYKDLLKKQEQLEDVGYKENEAEEMNQKSEAYVKGLEKKEESIGAFVFLDYLTWQKEVDLKSSTSKNKLIVTNKALCAGGTWVKEYSSFNTFIDGCFFYGKGNIATEKNTIVYDQQDISLYGVKISVGAGKFVSPGKAELGFKIPIMYTNQDFTAPSGFSLDEGSSFSALASMYLRFPYRSWHFQTEFAKFLSDDTTLWGLGIGYKF